MRNSSVILAVLFVLSLVTVSCNERPGRGEAVITLSLSSDYSFPFLNSITKSVALPDTNDFILTVRGSEGNLVYNGHYGKKPDKFTLPPGSYEFELLSGYFPAPCFDTPQFGDTRTIFVNSGDQTALTFRCFQVNSGCRLIFDKSFKDRFYGALVAIIQDGYVLEYPFSESRYAYFSPGIIRVVLNIDGVEVPLLTRNLSQSQMLSIRLLASNTTDSHFKVDIDTSRYWLCEDVIYGTGNDGSSIENALSVDEIPLFLGAENVWIQGYIVGGDVTSSTVATEPPFTKSSHIAIASHQYVAGRDECAAVELLSASGVRDELNLVENPSLLGRIVYVKGRIVNYFGYPGVKGVKEFYLP